MTLGSEMYVVEDGVLYVLFDGVTRIVVPECCRSLFLHFAHTIPWSGHLAHRGGASMYTDVRTYWGEGGWPSMYTDVRTYCSTCPLSKNK